VIQMRPCVIFFAPDAVARNIRTRDGLGFQTPKKYERMQNLSAPNLQLTAAGRKGGRLHVVDEKNQEIAPIQII
jgi:hypothetical protein